MKIEKGTTWTLKQPPGDPWPRVPVPVNVVDVRDGWVQYRVGDSPQDNRSKRVGQFLELYEPTDMDWPGEIDA